MLKVKCGIFFVLFSICSLPLFAGQEDVVFDKIVVLKNKETVESLYSLSDDNLESLPFSSPVESLNVTLLNLQSRSPNSSIQADFSLRGSNFEGTRILLNGQRINDPQTGHHNSDIPITKEDILNIDILSGFFPLSFGPDAIGGGVNFVTKRPKGRKVILELSGGEYSSYSQLFSISDKINNLGIRFSLENRGSRGFSEDTDFKKFTASMASSLDIPLGSFDLDFGYQDKEFGAYDFYTPGLGYPSKEWTKTFLLNSGFNLNKGDLLIKPNFLWRRHFDKFMLDKTQVQSKYLAHHRTDIYAPGIYFNKEGTFLGKLGLGFEYRQEEIDSTTLGKHSRMQKSIFIDDEYSFNDRLSLSSIFRIDDYSATGASYTGSVRLSSEIIKDNFIHAGVVRAIRIPSFTELYYNDGITIGNPGLSPEKSLTYETGHYYRKGAFSLGSVVFLRNENNFIDWVKVGKNWEAKNITSSNVFGIEENIQYVFNDRFNLKANYAYINKSKNNNGYTYKYGENYARHLMSLISVFKFDFGIQEIGFTYKKTPSRNGWFLAHAKINYNLNKHSKIFISATNIFNVEYQEIAGIPSPGRWVEGGLRVEW